MPPEGVHLALIVQSAAFDRVHYALATAAAALAVGRPVTLFFTGGACRALAQRQGWRAMACADGTGAADYDEALRRKGLGDFETLLAACGELGATLMVCEMGLAAAGVPADALRDDLALEAGGLATFLTGAAARGQLLFV